MLLWVQFLSVLFSATSPPVYSMPLTDIYWIKLFFKHLDSCVIFKKLWKSTDSGLFSHGNSCEELTRAVHADQDVPFYSPGSPPSLSVCITSCSFWCMNCYLSWESPEMESDKMKWGLSIHHMGVVGRFHLMRMNADMPASIFCLSPDVNGWKSVWSQQRRTKDTAAEFEGRINSTWRLNGNWKRKKKE